VDGSDPDECDEDDIMDRKVNCQYIIPPTVHLSGENSTTGEENNGTEPEPYMCFDLNDKQRLMRRYIVRPAGTSTTLYCNPQGELVISKLEGSC